MRMKVGDLKRLSPSLAQWSTASGYVFVMFPNGVLGARAPDGYYTELEEKATDARQAKSYFVAWANSYFGGL